MAMVQVKDNLEDMKDKDKDNLNDTQPKPYRNYTYARNRYKKLNNEEQNKKNNENVQKIITEI